MLQTFWSWRRQGAFFLVCQILAGLVLLGWWPVVAQTEGLVISGFQVSGGSGRTTEEYVELYNSSPEDMDISGWRLAKLTKTGQLGDWVYLMAPFALGTVLPAQTFALAVHEDAAPLFGGDWQYKTTSLAEDNSIVLLDATGQVVDLVSWGQAVHAGEPLRPPAGADHWSRGLMSGGSLGVFEKTKASPRQGKIDDYIGEEQLVTSTPVNESNSSTEDFEVENVTSSEQIASAADAQELIISEVYSQPNTGEVEYVELYNPTESAIELIDWRLVEGGGSATVVSGTILAQDFLVVSPIKGSLNNSGDEVVLWQADRQIDRVAYGEWEEDSLRPTKGQSVLRVDLQLGGDWYIGEPSPGEINQKLVIDEAVPDDEPPESNEIKKVEKIQFNEILPDPVGNDEAEFIELSNTGNVLVDLRGWKLEVGEQEYIISEQYLKPGEYVAFNRTQTKIVFPNLKKEKIRLLRLDGSVVDTITHPIPAIRGAAWAYVSGRGWEWSQSSTPGFGNVWKRLNRAPYAEITAPTQVAPGELVVLNSDNVYDPDLDPLQYSWDLGDGQKTTSTGITTVYEKEGKYRVTLKVEDPFALHDEVVWTIQVLNPNQTKLKTESAVTPKKATSTPKSGVIKGGAVKNKTTKVVSSTKEADIKVSGPPLAVAARLLSENEARLVSVKGTVTGGSGKYWRLDDSTNEIVIILPASKQPTGFGFKKGTVWQISGVVKKYKDEWAVAPANWGEMQQIEKETASSVSAITQDVHINVGWWWAIGLFGGFGFLWLIKKRKSSALIPVSVV